MRGVPVTYNNYTATVVYCPGARIFHGAVTNTRDVITFEGDSVEELERAFGDSVEDYLDFCDA